MNIKYLLVFAAGAGLGSGLAYIILKDKHAEEIQELLDENNELYKQANGIEPMYEEYVQNDVDATEALFEEYVKPEEEEISTIAKKSFSYEKPNTNKTKYNRAVKPNLADIIEQKRAEEEHPEEDEDEEEVEPTEHEEAMPVQGQIYIIKDTDWSEEFSKFDKETLTYYKESGDLVDGRGEVLDHEDTIGSDKNLVFGQDSGSPYVVYIRNERLDTDFEIVLEEE